MTQDDTTHSAGKDITQLTRGKEGLEAAFWAWLAEQIRATRASETKHCYRIELDEVEFPVAEATVEEVDNISALVLAIPMPAMSSESVKTLVDIETDDVIYASSDRCNLSALVAQIEYDEMVLRISLTRPDLIPVKIGYKEGKVTAQDLEGIGA